MKNILLGLIFALAIAASAQQQTIKPPAIDIQVPPGTVVTDGAVNPAAIPDSVVIRTFYGAAHAAGLSSGSATHAAYKSAEAFLQRLQVVAPSDAVILKGRIANWAASHATFTPGAQPAAPSSPQYYEDIDRAAVGELAALRSGLSAHGWDLLMAELTRRKSTIKVYRVPAIAH